MTDTDGGKAQHDVHMSAAKYVILYESNFVSASESQGYALGKLFTSSTGRQIIVVVDWSFSTAVCRRYDDRQTAARKITMAARQSATAASRRKDGMELIQWCICGKAGY